MKKLAFTVVVFLRAALAAGEADGLIDAAKTAPPEFAADVLIRIAAGSKLETARRIELLEMAFERAGEAQQVYPRYAAALKLDGSTAYWNRLYKQELDRLSLRLRVVEALLPLDRGKAVERFARIPAIEPPRLKCEEFMVYDVARFYDVLARIVPLDSDAAGLVKKHAGSMRSAVQLAPMARVLAGAPLKDADFEAAVGAFAAAMGKADGDDRSFTFSTGIGKEVEKLVAECKRRKVSPLPLLEGYRLYLVANFSGPRCADNDRIQAGQQSFGIFTGQPAEQGAHDFIGFFNEKLRQAPLGPIQELEATPSRLEGEVAAPHFCQGPECKAFVEQFRGLVFGENGIPIPPAQRNTPEWQARLKDRLAALGEWKAPAGGGASEYFREKTGAYSELLNLAQNGPNRELVLSALLDFVRRNPYQKVNRIEWFLPVNGLIGRISLDPGGLAKFREELNRADDPLILLYARLEALAPRTADQVLPLL